MFYKKIVIFLSVISLFNSISVFAENEIQVLEAQKTKYPDYSKIYSGDDKYEKFNRKMFNLNSKLNKFVARPVHVLWASLMPQCGMNMIKNAYNNIEYPKRLASCIVQKDGQGVKSETVRFITNSTLGLGGMFDPAKKLFNILPTNETMDQALAKCNINQGTYLVCPILNSCTPRSLCGRALEAALDPAIYLASPITSIIKFGLMVNRTSYMQPFVKLLESTFADPYDIQKKIFGLESYIRSSNLDRINILADSKQIPKGSSILHDEISTYIESGVALNEFDNEYLTGLALSLNDIQIDENFEESEPEIIKKALPEANIVLSDYNAQTPVVDSMRTALFDNPDVDKSIWNELSIWNRSFAGRIKTGEISVDKTRANYKYRYILQKNKMSPLVILYPSVGEGINNRHSTVFAKLFYDLGYSVLIQGSHFHWEFVKSMPKGFCPGVPSNDAEYVRLVTSKIIEDLELKHGRKFESKIILGTSFGAMMSLFIADKESKNNLLGVSNYIAISPPIELTYALQQLDKNCSEFDKESEEVKYKTALIAAKIVQLLDKKNIPDFEIKSLPFSEEEGKLITTFLLRQKLSDLVFAIENVAKNDTGDFYKYINNMSFNDYVNKYLLKNNSDYDNLSYQSSLYCIREYLSSNQNYRIYHSLDDFFTNASQISSLKLMAGNNLVCLSNGSHLGFLYREEFLDSLKEYIENNILHDKNSNEFERVANSS